MSVSEDMVRRAFAKLDLAGCRPSGDMPLDKEKRDKYLTNMVEVWVDLLADVQGEAFVAAVAAHLLDKEACRWWPRPGELRERAQALSAGPVERAVATLDPDGAYAVVREYVQRRGPHWWVGGPHLRDARRVRTLSIEDVVERVGALCAVRQVPVWVTAGRLQALERGSSSPQTWESEDLIEVYGSAPDGRTLPEEMEKIDPWYDLEYHAPLVVEAARRATPWISWVGLELEAVPSHRKAFRDCYAALVKDQQVHAGESAARRMIQRQGGQPRMLGAGRAELGTAAPQRIAPPEERPAVARPALPDWALANQAPAEPRRLAVPSAAQIVEAAGARLSMDRAVSARPSTPVRSAPPPRMSAEEREARLRAAFELDRRQREERERQAGGGG